MSLSTAKAKLDAQAGDPATGYISKQDHKDSYDELVADTALTGATTAAGITVSGAVQVGATAGLVVGASGPKVLSGSGSPEGAVTAPVGSIYLRTDGGADTAAYYKTSGTGNTGWTAADTGTGDVVGPASATDNAVARFDGTTGKLVQNSGIVIDDSNNVTGMGTLASGAVTSSGAVQAAAGSGFVVGSSGPKLLSGTGSPEGVVTAPVGSTWRDTAATNGAIKWIKATGTGNTGWTVEYGDTGSRDVSGSLVNGWTATGARLRRIGQTVIWFNVLLNSTAATSDDFYTLPAGFRQSVYASTITMGFAGAGGKQLNQTTGGVLSVPSRGTSTYSSQGPAIWVTNDPWPTALPGSAA